MHELQNEAAALPDAAIPREHGARRHALFVAVIVPFLVTLLGIAPYALLPGLDGADRALVWVEGDEATLARASAQLRAERAFSGGLTRGASLEIPDSCAAGAARMHFEVRRTDEAQVARVALEQLASAAGARVCATDRFEIGRADDALAWTPLVAALLLPLSLLLGLRLASIAPWPRHRFVACTAMLAATTVVVAFAPAPAIAAAVATPAAVATAMAIALVHEAAFRGWLLARAIPELGTAGATTLSVSASVAAAVATEGTGRALAAAAIAVACSAMYVRTRSTAVCVAVHAIAAAALRATTG